MLWNKYKDVLEAIAIWSRKYGGGCTGERRKREENQEGERRQE